MTAEDAERTLSREEFAQWWERRMRRKRITSQIGRATLFVYFAILVTGFTLGFVYLVCGEFAWRTGIFLSALSVYCLKVVWRYYRDKPSWEDEVPEYWLYRDWE